MSLHRLRSPHFRWPILALLLVLAASLAPRAVAQADARILLNQKRMEIRQLIELVSKETGRTILFDDQVRGLVSLVAKRPVTTEEAWELLDAALHLIGFALVPSTVDQWRISRVADAIGESPFVGSPRSDSEQYVTSLIPIESANLQSVMNVLQPLAGASVTMVALEQSHSLIASGPERSIARLTAIADELDRVEERRLRQRVLRYRAVADVEPMIQAQFDSNRFSDRELEVWSDERTNSVIFRGADEAMERLVSFLETIDEPITGEGEIRVLRVLNRDAGELAQILGAPAPASSRGKTKTEKNERDVDDANRDRRDAEERTPETPEESSQDREGPNAAPDDAAPVEQPAFASGASIDLRALLGDEDYSIAVDQPTRSIVVKASERGHELIRELVEELDAKPQLIAVDVTVSELQTPTSWALALSYHLPLLPGDSLDDLVGRMISLPAGGGFGTAPIDQGALFGRVSRDAGLDFTVPGEGGVEIPIEDTVVIDAAERKFRNEVLLQPSLVLVAGEEHEIFVGANVPVPVSEISPLENVDVTTAGAGGLAATVRFDREDIGIRLTLEAQAGSEGPIQLDLETEISTLAPSLAGDVTQVGPTFVKQVLTAKASLDDGETAILGMLQKDNELVAQGGTPWLSDIPFLGWLWKARARQVIDDRLVIAVRARRISTPAELVADTIRRRLAFERQSAREQNLPELDGPPYGVRVTTRSLAEDADAIAQDLERKGHRVRIQPWRGTDRRDLYDVYVMGLDSLADAGDLAYRLSEDGWDADLVVFSSRS